MRHVVRFIDTPGLREITSVKGRKTRTDKEGIGEIVTGVTGMTIHKVLFILPCPHNTGGINPDDIAAFTILRNELREKAIFLGPIDIVLSRTENLKEVELASCEEELRECAFLNVMISAENVIYHTGPILNENFPTASRAQMAKQANRVFAYQNRILSDICGDAVFPGPGPVERAALLAVKDQLAKPEVTEEDLR